jgi:hypothetical protein
MEWLLTNKGLMFWFITVATSMILGWFARDSEIQNMNKKIKNLESTLAMISTLKQKKKSFKKRPASS